MWDFVLQAWVPAFSIPAALLVARKSRWAPVLGLLSQPGWYVVIARTSPTQWGVLVLCLFYTYAWCETFYRWWFKPCLSGSHTTDSTGKVLKNGE